MAKEEEERKLRREMRRIARRKQERARQLILMALMAVSALIVAAAAIILVRTVFYRKPVNPRDVAVPDYVDVNLLTPNPFSRPGDELAQIRGIVIHYVANPCSTARENRNYFENLKNQTGKNATSVSSHFVIGLEGEIVQCIPLTEIAYASNNRNADTISIECCHPDETGKFYDSTYESLVKLTAYLCKNLELKPDDVIRHYDVTGKICPKYFVDYPEEWEQFKKDVKEEMKRIKKVQK